MTTRQRDPNSMGKVQPEMKAGGAAQWQNAEQNKKRY